MANDIGWGSGAANNSIGWGQGKTNNTIDWGEIYDSSPSGETDLVGVIRPSILTSPVISGSGVVGQTLSTTDGTWSGTLPITYSYQWNRNGSEILGATFNTYTLVTADASASITCVVTATNAGGFASSTSNAISVAAAGDADANAFIAAAAITDTTQKAAIETLVVDLKGYGIWTKMKAIYPFVGGVASSHKFNLRNPLDTDAAFRLVFSGGGTHSSTGYLPNGVNGYANSFLVPLSILQLNYNHISAYIRSNTISGGIYGCYNAGAENGLYTNPKFGGGTQESRNNSSVGGNAVSTDSRGLWINTRIVSTQYKIFRNNTINQTSNTSTTGRSGHNAYVGAINANGTPEYQNREVSFSSIGDGLTDTEAANYYTAVQTFQTTLSRNV